MRAPSSIFFAVVAASMSAACAAPRDASEPESTAADPLDAVLFATPSESCKWASECASGICSLHTCVPFANINEAWMENVVASRVTDALKRHATTVEHLREAVQRLADTNDPYQRAHLAGLLGALGMADFRDELRKLAIDSSEIVRVRAHLALGLLADPATFDAVNALLTHRSEAVQLSALDAMAAYSHDGVHDAAASRVLLDVLEGRLSAGKYRLRQRVIALIRTGRLTAPLAKDALTAILANEPDGYLHHDARRALERLM